MQVNNKQIRDAVRRIESTFDDDPAVRRVILEVYKSGVRRGAKEGYAQALADVAGKKEATHE